MFRVIFSSSKILSGLAGTMAAEDDARGEQREPDDRQEEDHVARIEHAFLEAVEMGDHAERSDDVHQPGLAQLSSRLITGGKPARIRNRQITTERMKLTTWLRVIAEVMQLMAR